MYAEPSHAVRVCNVYHAQHAVGRMSVAGEATYSDTKNKGNGVLECKALLLLCGIVSQMCNQVQCEPAVGPAKPRQNPMQSTHGQAGGIQSQYQPYRRQRQRNRDDEDYHHVAAAQG